ncbi:BsuBI/PstI family type II restriction endonuclease [Fibrobacter sp. UWH1]|uniref:BsuBI/PstI family type II restriction endonuclease n=1 Tax=Fibrobacter sp. UWH1 TaxID=1964354 RepID=UPI000B5234AB|nr:BsuBI/PstI family type II restriction endonuclease [Fibrobacter sp. UWH1]OWV09743.1 hypothetical protein B7992_11770 [Fibrobacter sp. UWH1]
MTIVTTGNKTEKVKKLIFAMLDIFEATEINLENLTDRRKEKMACACLAVAGIKCALKEARSMMNGIFLRTRDIIAFENENYGETIAMGSYDDVRRKDLRPLIELGYVVNSADFDMSATNNPTRGYALSAPFCKLVQSHGTKTWKKTLAVFLEMQHKLREELERRRASEKVPVTLPSGLNLELSAGEHNILQKRIIEDFLPEFGMGAQVLYVGDTSNKYLFRDDKSLKSLNFFELEHDELPDIIAYSKEKNLLFLIEAVHSSGPMSESRIASLKGLLKKCSANIVFFTAFLDMKEFRKWLTQIAWETEVWIADIPHHLVHFNGSKFLEVYK